MANQHVCSPFGALKSYNIWGTLMPGVSNSRSLVVVLGLAITATSFTGMSLHWTGHISYSSWVTDTHQRATCLHSFQSTLCAIGDRPVSSPLPHQPPPLTLTPVSSLLSYQPPLHFQMLIRCVLLCLYDIKCLTCMILNAPLAWRVMPYLYGSHCFPCMLCDASCAWCVMLYLHALLA